MTLSLVHIHPRPRAALPYEEHVAHYLKLASRWLPAQTRGFTSEAEFALYIDTQKQKPALILCDQRGKPQTSEDFAAWVQQRRDAASPAMILAIGPADGWSPETLKSADLLLAFGKMTLPHALARLVLAEQIYRAATIIGGHPYHSGH